MEAKYQILHEHGPAPSIHLSHRFLKWHNSLAVYLLGTFCLVQSIALIILSVYLAGIHHQAPQTVQILAKSVAFEDEPRFRHIKTKDEVQQAWQMYQLPGSGFVHLSVDELVQHGLEPNTNVVSDIENVYMISMFHALHCLESIHVSFARMQGSEMPEANANITHAQEFEANHASHCFSYLRQSIACAGDMTLEGPDPDPLPGTSPLRGWGVPHVCRSWEEIQKWKDQHALHT